MYTNDLTTYDDSAEIFKFADDTAVVGVNWSLSLSLILKKLVQTGTYGELHLDLAGKPVENMKVFKFP